MSWGHQSCNFIKKELNYLKSLIPTKGEVNSLLSRSLNPPTTSYMPIFCLIWPHRNQGQGAKQVFLQL